MKKGYGCGIMGDRNIVRRGGAGHTPRLDTPDWRCIMDTLSPCPHFVYELVDPRDNSVFYVGVTRDLYKRFRDHMRCDGTNVQKDYRIQEIVASGHLPIMRTVERAKTFTAVLVRETHWIRLYLSQGVLLLNIAGVQVTERNPKGTEEKAVYKAPILPDGFIRYSTDRFLKRLYYRDSNGDLLCFAEVTGWQFIEYLSRYADHDWLSHGNPDSEFSPWNANGYRCQWLNHMRIDGFQFEIYNHRGERVTDLVGNPLLPQK